MDRMTDDERKAFIDRRVRDILAMYNDAHEMLSTMQPHERDLYVHKRVENDLLRSQMIMNSIADYIKERATTWRELIFLDGICLILLLWLSVNDIKDAIGFVFIVFVFIVSRMVNYRMRGRATKIFLAMQMHVNREVNTATLDFLVDEIDVVNGDKTLLTNEISKITEVGSDDDAQRDQRKPKGAV